MNDVKPGWKTTEFWLTAVASIIGLLFASDAIPTDGPAMKLLGLLATALSTMGYSISRGSVKKAAQTTLPLILCIVLAAPVLTGCSTPVRTAYIAEASVIATTDQAWNGWFDYVVAGNATQSQYEASKRLYNQYLAAKTLFVKALAEFKASTVKDITPLDAASQALTNTSVELTAFIKSFQK